MEAHIKRGQSFTLWGQHESNFYNVSENIILSYVPLAVSSETSPICYIYFFLFFSRGGNHWVVGLKWVRSMVQKSMNWPRGWNKQN